MHKYQVFFGILLGIVVFFNFSCNQKIIDGHIADQNFNKDWLFMKDTLPGAETNDYDDSNWNKVTVPHDWAIEGPFSDVNNARNGGLPIDGIAWYRKHFTIASEHKGKQISVEFDGVMDNSEVFINGNSVGKRHYGYSGFEYNLTPYINFGGDNVIAVSLAPEILSERWYPGAGIYRNVRLKINNPVHIPQWGTFIKTPTVSDESATVNVKTKIKNADSETAKIVLETIIKFMDGITVASDSQDINLQGNSDTEIEQNIEVESPIKWDIYQPNLYTAVSQIKIDGVVVDEYETEFGIRTIAFDAEKGFLLNGKPVDFNGVCMHHDLGPLGAAVNYRATERQMQIMKDMGANALRTSHNPPSPEQLQVCDRLGIVVLDEAFDEWKIAKVENGYHKYYDEWHERDLRDMIKRDRNHPSVIMWSIGNEILEQARPDGWKEAKHLSDICHDEDDSRPTTAGFNNYPGAFKNKLAYNVDIVGVNYKPAYYSEIVEQNPDMIFYGSETSSQTSSRGVYHLPLDFLHRKETNHVSSHDETIGPFWAYPPDVEFDAQKDNPRSLGEFIWTGFDYLGEPTPYGGRDNSTDGYWNDDWPSHASYFAPVDLCGFPKDRFYLYQSQWTTEPMVHVLPHWNWEEGMTIPVYSYTNCDEVELFLNGKSLGKKVKGKDFTMIHARYNGFEQGMYKSMYRLNWQVPFETGAIKVVGFKDGKEVATKEIKTAGKPAKIKLIADRDKLEASGVDLSFITVRIEDTDGNLVPESDNLVTFKVEGAGVLEAVGNGNQASLESFKEDHIKAFSGMCLAIIRTTESAGTIKLTAISDGLEPSEISITSE